MCVVIVPMSVRVTKSECVEQCCEMKLVANFHAPVDFYLGRK